MKVPYLVSSNTRQSYTTSNFMLVSAGETSRKIIAEDFEWDDGFTPAPLTYFAALALSRIFHRINPLHKILQKDVDMLMDLYPASIPLKYSVPLIRVRISFLLVKQVSTKTSQPGENPLTRVWFDICKLFI